MPLVRPKEYCHSCPEPARQQDIRAIEGVLRRRFVEWSNARVRVRAIVEHAKGNGVRTSDVEAMDSMMDGLR